MTTSRFKILLATDGSPGALEAADWIRTHYQPATTTLVVVAAEAPFAAIAGYGPVALPEFPDEIEGGETYQTVLDRTVDHLSGFTVDTVLKRGDPANVILATVNEHHPDLLVAGHRGLHGLPNLILGSVAQELVYRSPVPVLIIPHRTAPALHVERPT